MSHRTVCVLVGLMGCGSTPPSAPEPAPTPQVPGPPPAQAFHATPDFQLEAPPDGPQRSIVIISLDTVSAPILSLYGGPAETPVVARLAAEGTRFADAATHFPETCLSHWTMLSGVYPEAHGNAPAHAGSRYTGPTVAEVAQKSGYATGAVIGGVTLQDKACGLSRGFDHYDDQFAFDPTDMRRPAHDVTQRAVQWMNGQDQPFFLFVHYFDAHFPYTPPAPWDVRYDPDYTGALDGSDATLRPYRDGDRTPSARDVAHIEALYAGEVSALDADLAPLVAAIPEDAVVVVTADHGESFGHNYWFNHRGVLWDDVMRVPLVIRGLDRPAGAVVEGGVGLVDVARTVLSAAHLPADTRMAGRDLGTVDPATHPVPQLAITDPWVGSAWFAARLSGHKRIDRPDTTTPEWFDLLTDPRESRPTPLPADHALQGARSTWDTAIERWASAQVEAPVRTVPDDEAKRLEMLGYVDPTKPPQGPSKAGGGAPPGGRPHGKAPGQRHGPPNGARPPGAGG